MKPEGARYRAGTRAKGLSPEIPGIPVADAFHLAVGNTLEVGKRDPKTLVRGLKGMARCQKDRLGTREIRGVSQEAEIWTAPERDTEFLDKSIDDKAVQKTLRQSDKSIVAMKSSPLPRGLDGVKGLTEMRRDLRDTSSRLRTGDKTLTKIKSSDLQDGLEGAFLKSRVRGIKPKGG